MIVTQENLAGAKKQHQALVKKVSEMELEIRGLRERLADNDEACLELARIKSKHAEEIEAMRGEFGERLARSGKEAAEETGRLNKMIGELEGVAREQRRSIVERDEKIKWNLGRLSQLEREISEAWKEVEEHRSKIGSLKERVELVRADKVRALNEVGELRERLAWQEEEVRRKELETRALQGEVASSRERVAEAEERATLLRKQKDETETQLALLKGELDADCAEAFRIGFGKARMQMSTAHPDWDISFLKVEESEVRSSGEEEDDYEEGSDAESAMVPSVGEAVASEGPRRAAAQDSKVLEKGETSQTQGGGASEATEVAPIPDH